MSIPVLVIFAPTATGKTALTLKLFGRSSLSFFKQKAEIISADSMQVYKGFDIGTAKPTEYEQDQLFHHLLDIAEPSRQFSASDFVEAADKLCREIYSKHKLPVVAGGTGFYIRNFLLGLPETPPSDEKIRQKLKLRLSVEGNLALYNELTSVDPESAEKINPNDAYRICRALEVFYTTGKPRSSFKMNSMLRKDFDFHVLILEREREELYERINHRVDLMFEAGLEDEVRKLVTSGCNKDMPAMQAIGYSEWFNDEGKLRKDTDKIREEIKKHSRKYAKKQYTYMADIPGAVKIPASDEEKMIQSVENYLSALDLNFDL